MKNRQTTIDFLEFESEHELPEQSRHLLDAALAALDKAYAPYSHFQVAAAIRMSNGEIICGTNQENAAYPSGLCAERTALFYAGSTYPELAVEEIFVIARKEGGKELLPACPCGSCRQVMQETELRQGSSMSLFFRLEHSGFIQLNTVSDILPFRFDPASLK